MAFITIVGSGFVGSLLALALARRGIQVCIIDKNDCSNPLAIDDGRVSSLAFTSVQLLKALNIWPSVENHAQPINAIQVGDGHQSSLLNFGSNDPYNGLTPGFAMGYMVENTWLKKSLWQQLGQYNNITTISPAGVVEMNTQENCVDLVLDTGQKIQTALVVGADGQYSTVRALAGIDFYEQSYHQKALVTKLDIEKDHYGIAFEQFHPNGPFALLPLLDQQVSCVWCDAPQVIEEAFALEESAFTAAINRRFINPSVGALKAASGQRWVYDLQVKFSTKPYGPRCVLIGDAAHSIHPVAGQGLNLGIRDVAFLAESLTNAVRLGLDVGGVSLLQQYHRQRLVDVGIMIAGTHSLVRLFSNNVPPFRFARRLGGTLINHLPKIKNVFRNYAMGLKKPLPDLLQGRENSF